MKQSVGFPGRLASAHSVVTPLRRNWSGIAEKTWVSISFGGVSRYIICCFSHLSFESGRTIIDKAIRVERLPYSESEHFVGSTAGRRPPESRPAPMRGVPLRATGGRAGFKH